jgi:diaminopimelate decarboxylase/aspartate kinase
VIDEAQGDRLVQQLHERLIQPIAGDTVMGPSWQQLFGAKSDEPKRPIEWWRNEAKRKHLLDLAQREGAAYVYDLETLDQTVSALRGVTAVDRWAYAMKANWHADILRRFYAAGIALECVSQGELEHVFREIPAIDPERIIFTPNFAPRSEYEFGFAKRVRVTLDNLYPLQAWPELFRGREVFVRIDPGIGRGHHEHVRTAGTHSKFGIPVFESDELAALAGRVGTRIVGLHAHTGSGIFNVANWSETGAVLADLTRRFSDVRVVDLGGGLGVPEHAGQAEVELAALNAGVADLKKRFPKLEFWMEPGRYLVAKAGVLVARVTQLKGKGDVHYVGIATGMNSLIRPALYGSHHDIVNLSKLDQPPSQLVNVVGPICESADILGSDRSLPPCAEDDVLLIANTGAYGRAMSSTYNLRQPAAEFLLGS